MALKGTLLLLSILAMPLAPGDTFAQEQPVPVVDPLPLRGYTLEMMKPHLDHLASEVKADAGSQAYVIVYGGRGDCAEETVRRTGWARRYLSRRHGLAGERVEVVVGGYRREKEMEPFVRPAGHPKPDATPDLDVRQDGRTPSKCRKSPKRPPCQRA